MSLIPGPGRSVELLPALIGGRYTPGEVLGRGGAATVYRAMVTHETDVRRATRRASLSAE
jgi:hypothetical protein